MADGKVRYALIVWEALHILRDAAAPLTSREITVAVGERIEPTPHERELHKSGGIRWETALHFHSGDAATVGWITKRGGWSITEAGIEAIETYATAEDLFARPTRRYREIDERRKQAQQNLSPVQHFIAETLRMVEPGTWTAHDDLAELAGTTGSEVAHFLASGQVKIENSYRVLNADGSIPAEGMLNAFYRGTDLRARMEGEGVQFDPSGHASQDQRLTSDALKELRDARSPEESGSEPGPAKRAWMVRGSSVDGYNLVPDWLRDGFVSLSASQLGRLDQSVTYEDLRQAVERGYEHKSYAYREQRLDEFDRCLRRISSGDLVLTTTRGKIYLGEVAGPAYFVESEGGHSSLRRDVLWYNPDDPADPSSLRAPVPALLQSQAYVVDLTAAYDQLTTL